MTTFTSGVQGRLAVADSTFPPPILGIAHLAKVAPRFTELDSLVDLMKLTLEVGCQAAGYRHGWIISNQGNEVLARRCTDVEVEQTLLHTLAAGQFQNNAWCRSFRIRLNDDTYCDAYFASPVGRHTSAAVEAERKQVLQLLSALAGPTMTTAYRPLKKDRQSDVNEEIARGAAMQEMFFPPRSGETAEFRFTGESRVGKFMHGDFYDIVQLDEGRVAITLGDVAGKGIAASVIGTSIQSFLRASLPHSTSLAETVTMLNDFLLPRRPEGSFATLFIAILDRRQSTIEYVDAGHGYGFLIDVNGQFKRLDQGGGLPIGSFGGIPYEPVKVPLAGGERLLVVSDGIVEQQARQLKQCFDIAGLQKVVANASPSTNLVDQIFDSVVEFAGTSPLSDDATALLVEW